MNTRFTFSQFLKTYPDSDSCLDEIMRIKTLHDNRCSVCKRITVYYKLKKRPAYTCKYCRHQIYPLSGTIFEKSSTSLLIWFYAMFIMTQTKARISIKQLQRELGVTYKTAWRMYTNIKKLMMQNNGDLLAGTIRTDETTNVEKEKDKVYRWTLFNTVVISVVHKEESSADSA